MSFVSGLREDVPASRKEMSDMAYGITNEFMNKVENTLYEDGVWADVYRGYDDFKNEVLKIDISWGDWKHDHLRAKWVIEDVLGINVIKWETDVTEEDGSDCYSAIHTVWLGVLDD